MKSLPNFFIVGAPKAGTTSLYQYLKNHPDVFMSPIKEPNFFSQVSINIFKIENKEEYLKLFKNAKNEKAIGEASTIYLASPDAAQNIHDLIPDAKIIIILRDPVNQFFSGYMMNQKQGIEKSTLDEKINHLKFVFDSKSDSYSKFSNQIKKYLSIFGKNNVKIIIFEEFILDPKNTVTEILRFLDINSDFDFISESHNSFEDQMIPRGKISENILVSGLAGKLAKKFKILSMSKRVAIGEIILKKKRGEQKPSLSKTHLEKLKQCFDSDVKELEIMLGKKLPWPNFQS